MTRSLEVLALIPARGGSKSIPRKNLSLVGGKPLIAHSIDHGLASKKITRVIVTTDDLEIAATAKACGAEVPFLRPVELAGDFSVDYEFHRHALEWLRDREAYVPDQVVQLRPTTPHRPPELIDRAIDAFAAAPEADSLRAVVVAGFTPYKMWLLGDDGYLKQLLRLDGHDEPYNLPRQLLPTVYQQDGLIDITRPKTVLEQGSTTGRRILPFFIEHASLDIDYDHELRAAEALVGNPSGRSKRCGP